MQKEQNIKEKIKNIVLDGGIVTIDCEKNQYTPAPVRSLEECKRLIKLDKKIEIDKLLKLLHDDAEVNMVLIQKGIIIVVKRGTSIGVCYY